MFKLMILVVGISGIQSCKKGEEDPFMSLRSRKARLTGEWQVTSYETKNSTNGTVTFSESLSGTTLTTSSGGVSDTETYSYDFTFEKDGTYKTIEVEDNVTKTITGNWAFLGKNKNADIKKKEYLLLDDTKYTTVNSTTAAANSSSEYSNFQDGGQYALQIVKLSNKEILLNYVSTSKDNNTGGDTYETTIKITLTKK